MTQVIVGWALAQHQLLGQGPTYIKKLGFTLIEVLLALSVIAIALTALLKVSHQNVSAEIHLKDKLISTWIADDALAQIKLKMVTLSTVQDSTFTKEVFKTKWYWRAHVSKTAITGLDKIVISVSQKQAGPFTKALVGYR